MTDVAQLRGNWLVWGNTAHNLDRIRSVIVDVTRREDQAIVEGTGDDARITGTRDVATGWALYAVDEDGRRLRVSDEFGHEDAARDAMVGLLSPWDALQAVT